MCNTFGKQYSGMQQVIASNQSWDKMNGDKITAKMTFSVREGNGNLFI